MASVDTFIFHDDVQLAWTGFTRRVKIRTFHAQDQLKWLQAAIDKSDQLALIKDIYLEKPSVFVTRLKKQITSSYCQAPYFEQVFEPLCRLLDTCESSLSLFNQQIVLFFADHLQINTNFLRSSEMNSIGSGQEKIMHLLSTFDSPLYVSGTGARAYQVDQLFEHHGIQLYYLEAQQLIEHQINNGIRAHSTVSVLDWVMLHGFDQVRMVIHNCLNK